MTLYISYMRAWSLKNVTNGLNSLNQTDRKVMKDLVVFNAIIVIVQVSILFPVNYFFPYKVFAWFAIAFGSIWIIIEMMLAIYVLVTLRIRQRSVAVDSRRSTHDDFEKLVALVALVFSCALLVNVIDYVIDLDAKDHLESFQNRSTYFSVIAAVSNSSVNLLIYVIASGTFRNAFFRFMKNVVSRPADSSNLPSSTSLLLESTNISD